MRDAFVSLYRFCDPENGRIMTSRFGGWTRTQGRWSGRERPVLRWTGSCRNGSDGCEEGCLWAVVGDCGGWAEEEEGIRRSDWTWVGNRGGEMM